MYLSKIARRFISMLTASCMLIGCNATVDNSTDQTQVFIVSPAGKETFTPAEPAASDTPDPCTGWVCEINGIIYVDSADQRNELEGVPVKLSQHSWCSPTAGEQEKQSSENGSFVFEVFIHDTDSFKVQVKIEGYEPAEVIIGGFDCLYCTCPLIEIILKAKK